MTDRNFNRKLCGLVLVIGILAAYQVILCLRAKDENIAQLEAELSAYQEAVKAANEMQETEADAQTLWQDGIYTGTAQGFGGPVTVSLKIADGKISSVEVVEAKEEDAAYLEIALRVTKEIVENQNTDVDAVSGATFSSNGIREAAQVALEQAVTK